MLGTQMERSQGPKIMTPLTSGQVDVASDITVDPNQMLELTNQQFCFITWDSWLHLPLYIPDSSYGYCATSITARGIWSQESQVKSNDKLKVPISS